MNRHTFLVQVHAEGPCILENVNTRERVPVSDLGAVGAQIERWLAALPSGVETRQVRLGKTSWPDGRPHRP
jgi:hypothetical protein